MDHSNHTRLEPGELTLDVLDNATIYGPGDNEIGHVNHVHGSGAGGTVVIDVGGFRGIGAKRVGVPIASLDFMRMRMATFTR